MNKSILNNFNNKEKKTIDTYIQKKGYSIKVHVAEPTGGNASEIDGVEWVSETFGEIRLNPIPENRKIVLINSEFEFIETNISIILSDDNNNFNNFFGFIDGSTLPKGSIVEFEDFNIKLTIQRVEKKRPLSIIERYFFAR